MTADNDTSPAKNFFKYLPSLVGYVVVIYDDSSNMVLGTITSNTVTSLTVSGWTSMPGNTSSVPANGGVSYYLSASGQTTMFSDCRSNSTVSSAAAQGPHGSPVKWMLKGTNQAWPAKSAGDNGAGQGTLVLLGDLWQNEGLINGTVNGLFCLNCHSIVGFTKYPTRFDSTTYSEGEPNIHLVSEHVTAACVNCHIMVPHGGKISRLIGAGSTTNMPARYAFGNDLSNMYIWGYAKAAAGNSYGFGNCHAPAVSFCAGVHDNSNAVITITGKCLIEWSRAEIPHVSQGEFLHVAPRRYKEREVPLIRISYCAQSSIRNRVSNGRLIPL